MAIDQDGVQSDPLIVMLTIFSEAQKEEEEAAEELAADIELEASTGISAFILNLFNKSEKKIRVQDEIVIIPPPPVASIGTISQSGLVEIKFSNEMIVQEVLMNMNHEGLILKDDTSQTRRLN